MGEMAEEFPGYTLKEVIEKNFSDLKVDMRTGFSDIKVDLKEVRNTADDADKKATAANRRLDTYDKHLWLIYGGLILGIIKTAFDWIGK